MPPWPLRWAELGLVLPVGEGDGELAAGVDVAEEDVGDGVAGLGGNSMENIFA